MLCRSANRWGSSFSLWVEVSSGHFGSDFSLLFNFSSKIYNSSHLFKLYNFSESSRANLRRISEQLSIRSGSFNLVVTLETTFVLFESSNAVSPWPITYLFFSEDILSIWFTCQFLWVYSSKYCCSMFKETCRNVLVAYWIVRTLPMMEMSFRTNPLVLFEDSIDFDRYPDYLM